MAKLTLLCLVGALSGVLASDLTIAPYFMPFDGEPQSVDDIVAHSGIKSVILSFVLASGSQCVPAWNGDPKLKVADDQKMVEFAKKIRANGGDIGISFGGYNGHELGTVCNSAEELAHAYQQVIDKYQLSYIDLDIEGNAFGNVASEKRRFDAIKILKATAKKNNKKLVVSLTIPVIESGFNWDGKEEIKAAVAEGLDVDLYTPMVFDFNGSKNKQGQQAKAILEACHQQLKAIRTDLNDQQIWQRIGMTLMNGRTDKWDELYTQETFKDLISFASEKGLARVSFWSLNRDRPCPDPHSDKLSPSCSTVPQQPYEFSKIISQFRKH